MNRNLLKSRLRQLSAELAAVLTVQRLKIACAESCTGGLLAQAITEIAGSSAYFERGIVAYSNEAKRQLLGVESEFFELYGAVSEPVVRQMAAGLMSSTDVDLVIAISGITGPNGGTAEKPVGTVWFCWLDRGGRQYSQCRRFRGERQDIRLQSAIYALETLLSDLLLNSS
jgi:nicotinamide-nucleotide amidase